MSESSSTFSVPSQVSSPITSHPSSVPSEEPSSSDEQGLPFWSVTEALLKDRERLFQEIEEEKNLKQLIPRLIWITLLCTSIVGAILGSYTGGRQVVFVALKLPMLFLFTLGLCLSAFWSWSLYYGLPLRLQQVVALSLMCIAVTSLLLLGLSPFLWQLLSGQSRLYHWAILAMVGSFGCAGLGGVRVLSQGLHHLEDAYHQKLEEEAKNNEESGDETPIETKAKGQQAHKSPNDRPHRMARSLSFVWICVYGLVGLQMSWILRPYLSHPWSKYATPFVRAWEGNVFASLIKTIASALGL
ncbi:MAG: hypothetical protein H6727_09490 [Myxococcales bacterium]|nr:hypothetical protein [Myxococcales bacterium]